MYALNRAKPTSSMEVLSALDGALRMNTNLAMFTIVSSSGKLFKMLLKVLSSNDQ